MKLSDLFNPAAAVEMVVGFVNMGGLVLIFIGVLLFLMWSLIFERIFFFKFLLKDEVRSVVKYWEDRQDKRSWRARKIREALISETVIKIKKNMALIKTMVALAPMLGLLGTVTGMILVFHIMAITGGGDPKSMAGGVSKATVPTMAGMVAALSGVFAQAYLSRIVERECALIEDHLTSGDDPAPSSPTGGPRSGGPNPVSGRSAKIEPDIGRSSLNEPSLNEASFNQSGSQSVKAESRNAESLAQQAAKKERFVDRFPPGATQSKNSKFDDDGLV